MKNKSILPNTLVPSEIRLEVYKEALETIVDNKPRCFLGLCLLLPVLLNHLMETAPNGEYWLFAHTENMFPEMKGIVEEMNRLYRVTKDYEILALNRKVVRERYLNNAIDKLQFELQIWK